MSKRYSDLVITDDIFDENMERTAEENGFSHLQFLKFVEKLPEGFSYGEFTIQGHTLYASWEETDFYKTARSGFISVDLAAIGKQL